MKRIKPDKLCEPFSALMSSAAAGAIGSVGSGLIQSGFNQLFAKRNARIQRDMQADLMHLQDRINDENLKDEREYNDPSAVASRARSAGVAPSALLGGAPGGPGISSTNRIGSGTVSAPVSNSHWPGLLSGDTISGLRNAETTANESGARIQNLEAQTEQIKNDIAWDRQRRPLEKESIELQIAFDRIRNYVEESIQEANIELAWENLAKASQERATLRAQEQQYTWVSKQIKETIDKIIPREVELITANAQQSREYVRKLLNENRWDNARWNDRLSALNSFDRELMNGEIDENTYKQLINPIYTSLKAAKTKNDVEEKLAGFYKESAEELKQRGLVEQFKAEYNRLLVDNIKEGSAFLTWEDRVLAYISSYANVIGAVLGGGAGKEVAKTMLK